MGDSTPTIDTAHSERVGIQDDSKSKKRQRTSEVWNHFTHEEPDENGKNVRCNKCGQRWKYEGTRQGTSTFNRHMLVCKKKSKFGDVGVMFTEHQEKLEVKNNAIDPKICRDWMTKITVAHNLPLNWVECDEMRGFLKYLNPDIEFISRDTHALDVLKLYDSERLKLRFRLSNVSGMLHLTCDVWTACTNSGYICLTAHFVDENWKLNSKILAVCFMPPPHSGIEIARKVYDILAYWKIDRKVFSLTLDSSSANNKMVEILKMQPGLHNSLLCNGEFFRVKCCAHLLTLMVQEGLEVASEALDKIRASVKYVKASEARMIMFKECARKTGIELPSSLCLDVPTRWESIYLMLDSGIKCRRAFCLLEFEDLAYKYCLTEEEWNRGELMLKFLEPFYNISTMISGSSSPTSGFFFIELWKIARFLSKNYRSQDEEVKSMSHSMNLKFAPYWEEHSEILSIGAVFDPRIKLKLLEYCYSRIDNHSSEEKISKLKTRLYTLYDEYKKKCASASLAKVSQVGEPDFMEEKDVRRQEMKRGLRINKKVLAEWKKYRGGTSEEKSFLDSYLDEPAMDVNAEIDLFEYWRDRAACFGELATMACDALSIPITTVTSDSSFSVGARVLKKYRNRVLSAKVRVVICTRNWLHGYSDDDEDDEFEKDDKSEDPKIDDEDDEFEEDDQSEDPKFTEVEECCSNV